MHMNEKKLLIADDSELNRAILINVLEKDFDIIEASNGREAISAIRAHGGDLAAILLDIVMPVIDGFEVLNEMKRSGWIDEIPVIMISAEAGGSYIDRAFRLGASDYVSRPFVPAIIRRRILNAVLLHEKKDQILTVVSDRFYRHGRNNDVLVYVLDYAIEQREGAGGLHMAGVELVAGMLLRGLLGKTDRYNIDYADIDTICAAARLHDIGKLKIPDSILQKPEKLSADEFEVVKRHTLFGARMISELPAYQNESLIKYAMEICRWHHERWNGEGYPDGLRGDEIPIAAQAVSLADAYDALVSERCYKNAYTHKKAMKMINSGECGSFNPLLLECLNEISELLGGRLQGQSAEAQSLPSAGEIFEDLYNNLDTSTARLTAQFEELQLKHRFIDEMTDDLLFEYTTHPKAIMLSSSAARLTGLPRVVVNPEENTALLRTVGKRTIEGIRAWLAAASSADTYFELEEKLVIEGKPRWCQLKISVGRSASERGRPSFLLGKVNVIDDSFKQLKSFVEATEAVENPMLISAIIGQDNIISIKKDQIGVLLHTCRQTFETVRIVDPDICMQVALDENGKTFGKNSSCYDVWGKMKRCERCISQDAIRTRMAQTKVEVVGSDIYYIIASCIRIEGKLYSLELVNPIRISDMLNQAEDDNLINQLLMRNRQIYIDSVTKVYNRRYYDEQLSGLTGSFAFAMIDMDNFKHINDAFGHLAGDAALYRTAQAIKSEIRSNDELVRYGGDEFFLLLHDMPHDSFESKLQSIRKAVERIEIPEYPELNISASIGGAHTFGQLSQTIQLADAALYESKATKNCVTLYREEDRKHDDS